MLLVFPNIPNLCLIQLNISIPNTRRQTRPQQTNPRKQPLSPAILSLTFRLLYFGIT